MKVCPNCQTKYPDDANFCPQEGCATPQGPRRLEMVAEQSSSRYQLREQLGGSRSGEVWRAYDNQVGATCPNQFFQCRDVFRKARQPTGDARGNELAQFNAGGIGPRANRVASLIFD